MRLISPCITAVALLASLTQLRAQSPQTPAECQARCADALAKCKTNCKPGSGPECEQMCKDFVDMCRQSCEALGALQGQQTPAPSKPGESRAAVDMKSMTLQVGWISETVENTTNSTTNSYRFYRSTTKARSELRAEIALRVPDIDYTNDLVAFSYLAGQVSGPEYLEVPHGKRQRLPTPELMSFTGASSYTSTQREEKGEILGPDCTTSLSIGGSSNKSAPTTNWGVGAPSSGRGGSFRVAFSGEHAMVEVIGPLFDVAGTSTSTCSGGSKESLKKQMTVGASITDPTMFAAAGMVDPACKVDVGPLKEGQGYAGSAVCTKPTSSGGQETSKLTYRIELRKTATTK